MIVAERKPFAEIKDLLADYQNVLVVGCATCVAVCLTGGEKETTILANQLELAYKAAGEDRRFDTNMAQRQCDMEFMEHLDELVEDYDALLSLACGAGIQFLSDRFPGKVVLPAVNTTFVGANVDVGVWEEKCRLCGKLRPGDHRGHLSHDPLRQEGAQRTLRGDQVRRHLRGQPGPALRLVPNLPAAQGAGPAGAHGVHRSGPRQPGGPVSGQTGGRGPMRRDIRPRTRPLSSESNPADPAVFPVRPPGLGREGGFFGSGRGRSSAPARNPRPGPCDRLGPR